MSRKAARIKALQALFAVDLGRMAPERAIEELLAEEQLSPQAAAFARELVMGTITARQELDAIISKYAVGWRLERLAAIDRNILRMALFEMKFYPDTPVNIIINEAIELAKTFNNEEAGKFVNGLLDSARKELGR
ncbi:transcription antitermination factor NusB [Moorella sulfitireducens (nom. illeg.)]|uniref:transcription antitermination factor NusB n=1 Tax=Neomoorella sulfitireducens TaxID=2972948 RepID=UPI0021ABB824|nr:transcription antitermination factor NusB [Moorella sulfitireducens]